MKKILFILLALSFFKVEVSALSENTNSMIIEDKLYKYYKLEKVLGPYDKQDANNTYEYIDYDDYILTEKSDYSLEPPDSKDRIITETYGYKYKIAAPVNYLTISSSYTLNIRSLKIYYKNEQIKSFQTVQYKGWVDPLTGEGTINSGGFDKLIFDEPYYLEDLRIEINLGENEIVDYSLETGSDDIYSLDYFNNNINFEFKNSTLINPKYEYFYDFIITPSNTLQIISPLLTYYQYQDKLYRHYNLVKVYNDEYTDKAVGDFIYKDENDYKIVYKDTLLTEENKTNDVIKLDINKQNETKDFKPIVNNKKQNNIKTLEIESEIAVNKETPKDISDNDKEYKIKFLENLDVPKNKPYNMFYLITFVILAILIIIILLLSNRYKR